MSVIAQGPASKSRVPTLNVAVEVVGHLLATSRTPSRRSARRHVDLLEVERLVARRSRPRRRPREAPMMAKTADEQRAGTGRPRASWPASRPQASLRWSPAAGASRQPAVVVGRPCAHELGHLGVGQDQEALRRPGRPRPPRHTSSGSIRPWSMTTAPAADVLPPGDHVGAHAHGAQAGDRTPAAAVGHRQPLGQADRRRAW